MCIRDRVLFRPHWSNKYHEFICGHCKIEFSLIYDKETDLDLQLKDALDIYLIKHTGMTMKQRIQKITDTMTPEQMQDRLNDLDQTYH